MLKLTNVWIGLLVVLLIGCSTDGIDDGLTIGGVINRTATFVGLPATINGVSGSDVTINFAAIVFDLQGETVADEDLSLILQYIDGSVVKLNDRSDVDGKVQTELSFEFPDEIVQARIDVLINSEMISQYEFELIPHDKPARLLLQTESDLLNIPHGVNGKMALTATVVNSDGVSLPGIELDIGLLPQAGEENIFGSLNAETATDESGDANVTFNTEGGYGVQRIGCQVTGLLGLNETIADTLTLTIQMLEEQIGVIGIIADPIEIYTAPNQVSSSNISASVKDSNGLPLPFVPVEFSTDLGDIGASGVTDADGRAQTHFHANSEPGLATIQATVPNSDVSTATQVLIRSPYGENQTLTLTHQHDYIYADNGITMDTIRAFLKDENGSPVAGVDIRFGSTHGVIAPAIMTTDESGSAYAIFKDLGIPSVDDEGNLIPATITANASIIGISESVNIEIRPRVNVGSVVIQPNANSIIAGSADSIKIVVTAFIDDMTQAPVGTTLYLETENGRLNEDVLIIDNPVGRSATWYHPGTLAETASITAVVSNPDETQAADTTEVLIRPGVPARSDVEFTVDSSATYLHVAGIKVTLYDEFDNPVEEGWEILMETTLGTLTPTHGFTNSRGSAYFDLTRGQSAGVAQLTLMVPSLGEMVGVTTFTFLAGAANSITLSADPLELNPAGTGGNSQSTLRATLYDEWGNKVETAETVHFRLLNETPSPEGSVFGVDRVLDSAQTAGGVAVIALHAGTQVEGKLIRAYTWRDAERTDTVSTLLTTLRVVGGPPFDIDLEIDERGEDLGGGYWGIDVFANVYDLYNNPCGVETAVSFSVVPDAATIEVDSTSAGFAKATLSYSSSNTFDTLTIRADIAGIDGRIRGSRETVLPLQHGSISLNVTPGSWMIDAQGYTTANIRCWGVVKDGHNVSIDNAPVLFKATRGKFYWFDHSRDSYEPYPADYPVRKYTGWRGMAHQFKHNDPPGTATVYIRGIESDFFLDAVTPEYNVFVYAEVEGYDDVVAEPEVVSITRHP